MRLGASSNSSNRDEIIEFVDWVLSIGDGNSSSDESAEIEIDIPKELLIQDCEDPIQALIDFAYPNLLQNTNTSHYFQERGILAPTLEYVQHINDFILSKYPGEEKVYFSSDSVCRSYDDSEVQGEWFTTESLNEIKCSGIPNHKLTLKVGVPVMLMRNIDQAGGLCNGTRLMINVLGKNLISATVLTGTNIGDKVLIPRMNLIPSDPGLPFKFQRRQFPLVTCFAMTINKSQWQSLSHLGIYLPRPVFTHGQYLGSLQERDSSV
jgi:ATP-dependent DNA helicase PIF1